jgi:hypothetical protein
MGMMPKKITQPKAVEAFTDEDAAPNLRAPQIC